MVQFTTLKINRKPIEKMFMIGRGDGCFVAYSRGSPHNFHLLAKFYSECYQLEMDTLDKLSSFIGADDIDAIKLLYGEYRNNASIGAHPEILWL